MSKHGRFILTPIEHILEESSSALSIPRLSVGTLHLGDYVLQSTFLKMTGFLEQKLSCFSWEIATDDYEFRFHHYGEYADKQKWFSTLEGKTAFLHDVLKVLNKYGTDLSTIITDTQRGLIFNSAKATIETFVNFSKAKQWYAKEYENYQDIFLKNVTSSCFFIPIEEKGEIDYKKTNYFKKCDSCATKCPILSTKEEDQVGLTKVYALIYRNRNRCAHNSAAYVQNLPNISILSKDLYVLNNYLIWFFVLVVLDKIYILLYKEFAKIRINIPN